MILHCHNSQCILTDWHSLYIPNIKSVSQSINSFHIFSLIYSSAFKDFASRSPEDGEHVLLLDQIKEVGEVEERRELGAARA